MNPYAMLSSRLGTSEATALGARLSSWHDAMVAHERRLRVGTTRDGCDDECPHAEARALWLEALATFGAPAHDLIFLRSRANESRRTSTRDSQQRQFEAAETSTRTRAPRSGAALPGVAERSPAEL